MKSTRYAEEQIIGLLKQRLADSSNFRRIACVFPGRLDALQDFILSKIDVGRMKPPIERKSGL
jgi:hypothetical protein